ncbi:MAG: phosphoribosylglycinamide formyltransferase [Alphaproteobacteria bacterium]
MANNSPIRAAVFASGNGTNAENILTHCKKLDGIEAILVLTDQPYAGVIERAKKFGTECEVVQRKQGISKEDHEKAITDVLKKHKVDWIFLAGYMRILSPDFVKGFHDEALGINRIVNIHPSLLPAFPGTDSYLQAFNAGVKISGVTLHFVDDGVDTGPIILQRAFERAEDEEPFEKFRARGMALEYEIYAEFLKHLIDGTWRLEKIPGTDKKIVCLGKEKAKEKWAQQSG